MKFQNSKTPFRKSEARKLKFWFQVVFVLEIPILNSNFTKLIFYSKNSSISEIHSGHCSNFQNLMQKFFFQILSLELIFVTQKTLETKISAFRHLICQKRVLNFEI
jgi:hypothetical protein